MDIKSLLIQPERALPGRDSSLVISANHFVNDQPITPPFSDHLELADFGLGCFWGAERIFWSLDGVDATAVGYMGGYTPNPTYEEVCSGMTGHTEAVRVIFDSKKISYEELLRVFWESHNPTQGMRQGNDLGTQYRSVIFYNSNEEKEIAEKKIKEINESGEYDKEVATDLRESVEFYEAEEYHQDFVEKNGKICYHQLYVENKQSSKN